ncbi:MAG: response regulator [Ferruginibacter sp.]
MISKNAIEILLVEDDEDDARLIYRALKGKRLLNNLVHLKDGNQAIDFLFAKGKFLERKVSELPKVILLDLEMNGIEVLKKIRSDERTSEIPIIIITSSKENPDLQTCFQLGASSYILKPVIFEDFLNAIAELGCCWFVLKESMNKMEQN